ncbi:MAG: topoisomerase DNA-binding C4 zinc finger domain-containing protein [Thomasclavelia ramosa]
MYIIIKAFLDDLINLCYKEKVTSDILVKYHKFYLKLEEKELKSKLGHYIFSKKAIHLFNIKSNDNVGCIITLIHELSHHIDYMNRGISDHSKAFYDIHIELIMTLFKMRTISYNEFICSGNTASNSNKLKRMVEKHYTKPEYLDYENEKNWLIVKNCYEAYKYLKEQKYVYNFYIKSWMKKININDIEKSKTEILNACKNATFITRAGHELIFNLSDDCSYIQKEDTKPDTIDEFGMCPECGGKLIERHGKYGTFVGCSNYPKCEYIKDKKKNNNQINEKCPQCGSELVEKHGRFGKFIGCSNYPKCKFIKK